MTSNVDPSPEQITELIEEARSRAHQRILAELVDELSERYRDAVQRRISPPPAAAAAGSPDRAAMAERAEPTGPAARAWYLYAIIRAKDADQVPAGAGVDDEPFQVLPVGAIAAVAAHLDLAGFHSVRPDDPDMSEDGWLAGAVRAHDRVVAETFELVPVLPLRFGCLYPGRGELLNALADTAPALLAELSRLDGAAEWTVRVATGTTDDEVPEPDTAQPTDGTSWLRARREAVRRRHQLHANRSDTLQQVAETIATATRDTAWRGSTDDAVELTCLVDRDTQDKFHDTVRSAGALYPDTVGITVRGPHPPYHFVQLPAAASGHG